MADAQAIGGLRNEVESEFDKAVGLVLGMGKRDYPSVIGGLNVASGISFDVSSPIDRSIIFGTCQEPEEGLTDRAVAVAKDAYANWSKTSAGERKGILSAILGKIEIQRKRLEAMVAVSVGMTEQCAAEEVGRLSDIIKEISADLDSAKGKPVGVWAVLTSYNSPLAAPIGYALAAAMAGNTVVMIPSANTVLPVFTLLGIIRDSGMPEGVVNVILDRKSQSTNDLANNIDVAGVVASGSGDRMEDLMFLQADDELIFVNDIKGMNPVFVYKPSDVKAAARQVLDSAFRFSGQKTQSCSKVVLIEGQQNQFVSALTAEAKTMKIGDPLDSDVFAGPVISQKKMEKFEETVGSTPGFVLFGGKKVRGVGADGYYVTPAIVTGLDDESEMCYIDSELPILVIQTVKDVDDAIEVLNCTECGTSAGIITKDEAVAERFSKEVIVDDIYVNSPKGVIATAGKAKIRNFMRR